MLPSGWTKHESRKYTGKFYYANDKTRESRWTPPLAANAMEPAAKAVTNYKIINQSMQPKAIQASVKTFVKIFSLRIFTLFR